MSPRESPGCNRPGGQSLIGVNTLGEFLSGVDEPASGHDETPSEGAPSVSGAPADIATSIRNGTDNRRKGLGAAQCGSVGSIRETPPDTATREGPARPLVLDNYGRTHPLNAPRQAG
jgi:hypothetical protein